MYLKKHKNSDLSFKEIFKAITENLVPDGQVATLFDDYIEVVPTDIFDNSNVSDDDFDIFFIDEDGDLCIWDEDDDQDNNEPFDDENFDESLDKWEVYGNYDEDELDDDVDEIDDFDESDNYDSSDDYDF